MAQTIEMPKFGDEMVVGTLGRWLKNEGDPVKAGEALAEIETDKATLELESPADGILLKRFVGEGDKVPVDSPVCVVGNVGERFDAPHGAPPKPLSPREAEAGTVTMHSPRSPAPGGARIRISPLARRLAREKGISPATVVGSGPRGRILRMDILAVETRGLQRPPRNS
ncbi:MAG TPA: biotin/lipoyl-containing protein, partial [Planctomycetaceae bacterium]|nr:biotin/lipoyl-containing protein [Planctomycetaceae bacterium]